MVPRNRMQSGVSRYDKRTCLNVFISTIVLVIFHLSLRFSTRKSLKQMSHICCCMLHVQKHQNETHDVELGVFVVPCVDGHRDAQMVVEVRFPILVSETHRETPAKEIKHQDARRR